MIKSLLRLSPGQIEPLGTHTDPATEHLYMVAFEFYDEGELTKVGNYEVWLSKPFGPGSMQAIADYIKQAITGELPEDDDLTFVRVTGVYYAGEHNKPIRHQSGAWVELQGDE